MELTKQEKELYNQCLGKCNACMLDGGCNLQKKLYKEEN
jgi:hypothetical protein